MDIEASDTIIDDNTINTVFKSKDKEITGQSTSILLHAVLDTHLDKKITTKIAQKKIARK